MERDKASEPKKKPLANSGCEIWVGSFCNFRVAQAPISPRAELLPYEHGINRFEFLLFFYLSGLRTGGKRLMRFEAWLEGLEDLYAAYPEFSYHLYQAESEFWTGNGTPEDPIGIEIREEFLTMSPAAAESLTKGSAPLLGQIDLNLQLEKPKFGPGIRRISSRDYQPFFDWINQENRFGIKTRLRIPGCQPLEQRFPIRLVLR